MATDFKKITINMMLASVFILAVFSFVIVTQQDNDVSYLITNDSIINDTYGDLYSQLDDAKGDANLSSSTFGTTTPTQSYGIVDVTSVVSPTRIFKSLILGTYNIMIQLPVKILGVPPIIVGVIDAVLILLVILGIWAIWRGVAT